MSKSAQMNTPTLTTCTACGSTDTRLSRWRSHDERTSHPGLHPFRCSQCGHRFLARAGTRAGKRRWPIAVAGAAALALLAIIGATLFVVTGSDQASEVGEQIAAGDATLEAARRGDPDAQFRVARAALLDPERGKEATRQAVDWLRQAAESGHTGAMIHLGKLYKSGVGTPQNYALAARWLGDAARAGDAEGMVEFGRLHRSGVGVEQNAVEAYVWFNRAAAALSMEGVQERDSIALKLAPEELERAQALSLEDDAPAPDAPAAETTLKASSAAVTDAARGD